MTLEEIKKTEPRIYGICSAKEKRAGGWLRTSKGEIFHSPYYSVMRAMLGAQQVFSNTDDVVAVIGFDGRPEFIEDDHSE